MFEDVDVYHSSISLTPTSKYIDFCSTFKPKTLAAGDKTVLYLGADNKLYYPSAAVTIGSCRGYFQLKGINAGDIATSRIKLNFGDGETTEIRPTPCPSLYGGEWYDLSGRKLNGKPTAKGLYIKDGKKVVIK